MTAKLQSNLLTAKEYGSLPDDGRYTELVRGMVIEMDRPYPSHSDYLNHIGYLLTQYVDLYQLGRVVSGDVGGA